MATRGSRERIGHSRTSSTCSTPYLTKARLPQLDMFGELETLLEGRAAIPL